MNFLLDTGDLGAVKEFLPIISGVTTNRHNSPHSFKQLETFCEEQGLMLFQEAYTLEDLENIGGIPKIPMIREYWPLLSILRDGHKSFAATGVYDAMQYAVAAVFQCNYAFVNYAKNPGNDIRDFGEGPLMIVGSFRTKRDVLEVLGMRRARYITVRPDTMGLALRCLQAEEEYA